MLSPFQLITKGAQGLINKGKDFAVDIYKGVSNINKKVADTSKKASDFIASPRGFEQEQINKANPTVKESFITGPKRGAEIFKGLYDITKMTKNPVGVIDIPNLVTNNYIKNKTGGLVDDFMNKVGEFSKPKTPGEAKLMQQGDVADIFFPIGSTKNVAKGLNIIAKTQDPNIIRKEAKILGLADDVVEEYLPSLIKESDPKALSKIYTEAITPKPLREKAIELEIRRSVIEESPLNRKDLKSFMNIKEGEFRELGDIKNPALIRKMEDTMAEVGISDPTEFTEKVQEFLIQKKKLANDEKLFKTDIKRIRMSDIGKPTPKVTGAEAKSLQDVAQQSKGAVDEPNYSFTETIRKKGTDIENKVGALDYVRTPERVFRKIGMGDEFDVLRKADEAYKKELPTQIDKITQWSKQVSPESNQRIFKYLDGQQITLDSNEQRVANEIKEYLAQWADRLGLPEDQRIASYITHIFEEDFIRKEFDEDLAKLIAERVPGSVYDPFLLERLGQKGYKEDTWAALDAYVKRGTRKANLDPALEGISKKAEKLEKSQLDYIQKYIGRVNMRPSDLDTAIDNTIKQFIGYKLGQRPVAKLSRLMRQNAFRGMIGANLGSAIRNISQGVNTYAKLGEKYTAIGYTKLATQGIGEAKALGVFGDDFITDRTLSATKKTIEKLDKALFFFFDSAEKINRGAAFYGARAKALAEGKTIEEAIEYGKKIVRDTQFNYGAVDTPVALQGDLSKVMLQFLSYPVKQTEFLLSMAKNKEYMGILRYALGGLLFTYTIGKTVGMDPKELIPFSGYVSGEQRFGIPPSLKLPVEVTKAVFNASDRYGQERNLQTKLKDIGKTAWGAIPGGIQMKKTLEGITLIQEGGSFDKGDKLQFLGPQTTTQKVQAILFGKYASKNAKDYFEKSEIKDERQSKVMPVYEQAQKLKAEGKTEEAQTLVDNLTDEEYNTYKEIKSEETAKQTAANKKKVVPIYSQAQQLKAEGKTEEAQALVDALSDEEYKAYELVKKQVEKDKKASEGIKPEYDDGEVQTPRSLVNTVTTYAKAIGVDPITAFNRILTGQKIRYVSNGTIVVERLPLAESQSIKRLSGQNMSGTKLDHTIPLQLGGSNDESNLNIVPNEIFSTYTPVENAIGKALREGKISKKEAQQLIKDFKNGNKSAQEVTELLK